MRRVAPASLLVLLSCGPFFYQAPPDIGQYPQRLAVKRWSQLFDETSPANPALPTAQELDATCRALPATLAPLTAKQRLEKIDRLLSENRGGDYSSARANFLHELRELVEIPEAFAAAAPYLRWRTTPVSIPPIPPTRKPWDMGDDEFAQLHRNYAEAIRLQDEELDKLAGEGTPLMMPYWLTRRGAVQFQRGKYEEGAELLGRVIAEHPDHPRAEAATLLRARCLIEQSRNLRRFPADPAEGGAFPTSPPPEVEVLLGEADDMLQAYLENHPKGRFVPDAHGWLGATAYDRGQYGAAMGHQLDRLKLQPTREITRTVLRECDLIFSKQMADASPDLEDPWLDPDKDFNAAAVASHPVVTRLFLQHALDPAGTLSLADFHRLTGDHAEGDRRLIRAFGDRIFRPKKFVRAALRALEEEILKKSSADDPVILHLLAWSATEAGEHEQALALAKRLQKKTAATDEAAYAKAIILQRAGHHAQATDAFRALATDHPGSPLLVDQPFRLAMSLARSGKAGEAILTLLPEPYDQESHDAPVLRSSLEITQWLDTLLQFAPLDELEAPLAALPADDRRATLLRSAVRIRAIAAHDFARAAKHLTAAPPEPFVEWDPTADRNPKRLAMDEAAWNERVAPLADLYRQLDQAAEADKPAIHLAIANHWMQHRGSLTLPLNGALYYANSEEEKLDLLRRRNALHYGYQVVAVNAELDSRDEATHALEHALKAAESKSATIAAPALELANHCLFRRAEYSLYQRSRALEADATALSRQLHERLTQSHPRSAEAKRSIAFTFRPAVGPWMPGDYNSYNAAHSIMEAISGTPINRWDGQNEEVVIAGEKIAALPERFLEVDPRTSLPALRNDLKSARDELFRLRRNTGGDDPATIIAVADRLDDLLAAASLNGITTADFLTYANNRKPLPPAFDSLVEFRKRLEVKEDETQPANDTIHGWQEFLDRYPDSPKAEAASFRLTRLIARNYRGRTQVRAFHFPDAPIPGGYKRIDIHRPDPTGDPGEVLAAISNHEMRFPEARYQADLDLLRAGAFIDLDRFDEALLLLNGILADPGQGDLHTLAALNFCDIAQRLLEPSTREKSLAAFRVDGRALAVLRLLVKGDTFLSRLQPMDL
ncbi:tetratricopeptide repeat protein [Luteolibacter sp. SL250]|uniref:tetratricopeptide repeat protein n=1 Tax=Luteolibacter sp. SL250 TaxID=2995170 RepID=UPI00226DC0A1|nr:tetratricopeptide repeat protein [Luteolibacter sp. SL250]WAC19577.1 tetratricopeptide repeat protein [Luteolibacter sp. SL250]